MLVSYKKTCTQSEVLTAKIEISSDMLKHLLSGCSDQKRGVTENAVANPLAAWLIEKIGEGA